MIFTIALILGLLVTMQAQNEAPPAMLCKDKFLIQSVIVEHGAMAKDIIPEMVASFGQLALYGQISFLTMF